MNSKTCLAVFAAAFAVGASAATVYVNGDNYGRSGMTGASVATGYGTIQEGVAAAHDGDVVLVAPGVYDKGGSAFDWTKSGVTVACTNRVVGNILRVTGNRLRPGVASLARIGV